jgi:large subunit ribosomal protein L11
MRTPELIRKEINLSKGSGAPGTDLIADISVDQLKNVSEQLGDKIIGKTTKSRVKELVGICQSMGIKVNGTPSDKASKMIAAGKWDNLFN